MNWTTISAYDASSWSAFYNSSTLFKSHFTADIQSGANATFTSDFYSLSTRLYNTGSAGLTDSFLNSKFSDVGYPIGYAETTDKTGADILMFKETAGKHLTNVWFDLPDDKTAVLHIGQNTSGVSLAQLQSDATSQTVDIASLITTLQTANNSVGTDYIVQPLYLYDAKTPLYTISGNAELAPYTVIVIDGKKILTIGRGICVEVE
jgi:hypothetical protein